MDATAWIRMDSHGFASFPKPNLKVYTVKNYLMINTRATANDDSILEFAQKIADNTDVTKFDIHTDLEDMFLGTNPAFIAELYSRCAWRLDTQLKNSLKQVARALPKDDGGKTIDTYSEISNALDEMWHGELNGFEAGFEGTGPLHMITAIRNVRESWHRKAQMAETARGRTYSLLNIETQIASPSKAEITTTMVANFEFEALKLVKGLSNVALRGEFRDGINMNTELERLDRIKRDLNKGMSDEQIGMLLSKDEEFIAILNKRSKLSSTAATAINCRTNLIEEQEKLHESWYNAEIKLVELQLHVYEYCGHHMQDDALMSDISHEFWTLPGQLKSIIINDAVVALDKTLSKFRNKSTMLYCQYSMTVDAAKHLLQRVLEHNHEDVGAIEVETDSYTQAMRSDKRRVKLAD